MYSPMEVMDDGSPTCWQGLDLGLCFLTPKHQPDDKYVSANLKA